MSFSFQFKKNENHINIKVLALTKRCINYLSIDRNWVAIYIITTFRVKCGKEATGGELIFILLYQFATLFFAHKYRVDFIQSVIFILFS